MAITVRKGTVADTESLIRLLEQVWAEMEHKEWFYLDPPEFVRKQMLSGTMQLWVAMDGDTLAGALDVLIPGEEDCNYGYNLNFSREELLRVIHMDSAAVRSRYRGQGLQKRLLQVAEEELQSAGNRILLCTVHPDNQFSLQNVLKQGYVIQKKLDMYGSVRYLLRKDI